MTRAYFRKRLQMECPPFMDDMTERTVSVVGSELVENYTVYIIRVGDGQHKWTVKHRYSDFHDLHEKLTAEKKVDRRLLPPKKILGKNSKSLVERRQKDLELYLQTLLQQFPEATPTPLGDWIAMLQLQGCRIDSQVLQLHTIKSFGMTLKPLTLSVMSECVRILTSNYEINGVTAALAEELFHKGEELLQMGEVFTLHPLQLYSLTQKLRLAKPTCFNGDAKTDLGHILDFTCRLRYLKISGTIGPVGTSNIEETSLPFDLSVFKSLVQIEISDCSSQQIGGLPALRSSLVTMSVNRSTEAMMSILVPEAIEFSQWEPEGEESACPVTAVIPVWRNLTTLDMSHNCISSIDYSVRLVPKVEFLDLSYNQLSSVENLQHLYNLVHVDLSYNNLRVLEAAHTRLGNIKTLNLAGNQLEQLAGLSKLYSLVNVDLSHNQLGVLEEIRSIGHLPCLEKLNLSSNPICIIPDYRTKVLAQFGDRAAEVCLDCNATTEKELDTVEVLKAIQKAKEVKVRMSSSDKKVSEDAKLYVGPSPPLSSSAPHPSTCSVAAIPLPTVISSSCPAQETGCSSQDVMGHEEPALAQTVPPCVVAAPNPVISHSIDNAQVQKSDDTLSEKGKDEAATAVTASLNTAGCVCCTSTISSHGSPCSVCSAAFCPLLPSCLFSLSLSNPDFISRLSQHFGSTLREKRGQGNVLEQETSESSGIHSHLESIHRSSSAGSRDGYFEMGLDDSMEESLTSPTPLLPAAQTKFSIPQEEPATDEDVGPVRKVLWCYCIRVEEELASKSAACLVLTDQCLGLLLLSHNVKLQDADSQEKLSVEDVWSHAQMDFVLPYAELTLSIRTDLPDVCLTFGIKAGLTRWFIFSEPEQLRQTRAELTTLLQTAGSESTLEHNSALQLLPSSLVNSWELEESKGAQGGYPLHLVPLVPPSTKDSASLLSELISEDSSPPCLLYFTNRHLWVLRMDFTLLAKKEGSNMEIHQTPGSSSSSWHKLVRVPLGSVALHPHQKAAGLDGTPSHKDCPLQQHSHRSHHSVELLCCGQKLLLLFPLAQDRSSFLKELSHRRASLEGLKILALPQPCLHTKEVAGCPRHTCLCCCTNDTKQETPSSLCSSLAEENQPHPHLMGSLSPALRLLVGLKGQQLLTYFSRYIALEETEELRQVLWLSVVLYKSPDAEFTCCLLLSTEFIYFLLEESVDSLGHQTTSVLDMFDSGDLDSRLCCCVSIRLSELMAVNVGLFDQYFRLVGPSADHVVCCLTRDSYGTGVFLQELMSVLSLQRQLPPPETSDQDFYSQFTDTGTGKMQNYELIHSSKVKFIYPSEEEMGDLTFIVAERKTSATSAAAPLCSFNILLYLLVFQVQVSSPGSAAPGSSSSTSDAGPSPVLLPRTLILTSTDVFLLDEDYVSYPLTDFAKEPPSRERYRLREARRIRDLDRVLMGYQTYPQALTLVFDDLPGPDLLCHLTMDHFAVSEEEPLSRAGAPGRSQESEVQWCVFVPEADSRERLISLLARQWEALCSRELPVELTG